MMEPEDLYMNYYAHQAMSPEMQTVHLIKLYIWPGILLFGTFSNLLSAIILFRLMRKDLSTYCYLFFAAITELLILYIRCGNEWLYTMNGQDVTSQLMNSFETICKGYPTVFNFLYHISIWLVVCAIIEGAMVAKHPPAIIKLCQIKRAKAAILLLVVLLICLNVHYFWTYEQINARKHGITDMDLIICTVAKYGRGRHVTEVFVSFVWPVINILLGKIIPLFIIITCLIIMHIHPTTRFFQKNRSNGIQPNGIMCSLTQSRRLLLRLSIFHIVCTLPATVYSIFKSYKDITNTENSAQQEEEYDEVSKTELANTICDTCFYIYLSTKLFLYIHASSLYRRELVDFLCCRCVRKRTEDAVIEE